MPATAPASTTASESALLALSVRLHTALLRTDDAVRALHRTRHGIHRHDHENGQATTEYALVLLAAALVGLMVVAWATAGGGGARISRLFNSVIDSVIDRV